MRYHISMPFVVRPYRASDVEECARLFFDAVHEGTQDHYDAAQRLAWAPRVMSSSELAAKLEGQRVFVAVDELGVAGFFSLEPPSYLDFGYVRPDVMGKGVAGALYDALLAAAREAGATTVTSHASALARRFLERRGWEVVERRDFEHNGVPMYNYAMKLELRSA